MKLNLSAYFILLITCSSILSCKKSTTTDNSTSSIFPVTVYPVNVKAQSNMHMFVAGTEITDQTKIARYTLSLATTVNTQTLVGGNNSGYTFSSKDSLKFSGTGHNVSKTASKYLISYTGNNSIDPLAVNSLSSMEPFLMYPTVSVPYSGGFHTTTTIAGYGDYSSFQISVFEFKYRHIVANINTLVYGLYPNEFNFNTVSKLGATDTIAVQEFLVNYQAK